MPNNSVPGSGAVSRMGITICLGSFVLAYNSVCLTNIASLLQIKNGLTDDQLIFQLSFATSCFNIGTIVSPLLYRKLINKFGQLNSIAGIDIIGSLILLIQLSELNFYVLSITRALLGFIIGISTSIISSFINSISPHQIYGRIGCYAQTLQTIGVSSAYILSYILQPHNKDDQILWRIYLGFPILAFVFRTILLRIFFPFNSIEYHLKKGQTQKIREYCEMVYHDQSQETVTQFIQSKSLKKISETNKFTWKRRFIVALVVIASNQFSGINGILFYAKQLFNKITHGRQNYTQIIMVLLSLMQVVSTLLSSQVADIKGRRKMLLRGQLIIAFILLAIFFSDVILSNLLSEIISQAMVILFVFAHVLVMNFTLGNLCVVYCAQIIQDITWIIITLKILSFLVALSTQYMIQYLGIGFMFLIFFGLTVMAHIYLRSRLLQTKGLQTSQIYAMFGNYKDKSIKLGCPEKQTLLLGQEQNYDFKASSSTQGRIEAK